MFLAWKGKYSDERLFGLWVDGAGWTAQAQIPGSSTTGPSLAEYDGRLYAAWKGWKEDEALWYARYDAGHWSPQVEIPGTASSVGPALCAYSGRLYAAWKGWKNDQSLWFSSFDGQGWSPQATIPGVASAVGPSLAVYDGKLFAAWRGVTGDEKLWFSSFDGNAWAPQQVIPNVGSSVGPSLAEYGGVLYATWKGVEGDQGIYYASFGGNGWSAQDRIPGNTGQDTPQNIGLRMEYQQTSQWCWIAVGVSIAKYYGESDALTYQCEAMTTIGQAKNLGPQNGGFTLQTVCCPTVAMHKAHPEINVNLADPYAPAAEFALENVGIPQVCIKSGGVGDALNLHNNNAGKRNAMSLDEIATEITAKRPVVVTLRIPPNGPEHFVAISGVLNDQLLICDPASGETVIGYDDFLGGEYQGWAIVDYYLTKAG
jgi:hypothetical protein